LLSSRLGALREAIREFESRYVKLPTEMRDYLLQLDGTSARWPVDQDARLFSFWQLAQIRPVNDELASYEVPPIAGFERYFVFADFMDWSWAYAINRGWSSASRRSTASAACGGVGLLVGARV